MAVERPVDRSDAYRVFFENEFSISDSTRACTDTMDQLRAKGLAISHTSLDGARTYTGHFPATVAGRRLLHAGVLSVPPEHNEAFLDHLAGAMMRGAHFYLSEVATPVHPIYIDVDMELPLYSKYHVELVLRIMEAAELNMVVLEESWMFRQFWKFRSAAEAIELNAHLVKYKNDHHSPEEPWTWLHVFRACLSDELRRADEQFRLPSEDAVFHFIEFQDPDVINVPEIFITLFVTALAKLCHRQVGLLYNIKPSDNSITQLMMVLGNKGPGAYLSTNGVFKVGAHLHMRNTLVNQQMDLEINQVLVNYFTSTFGGIDWPRVLDRSVYARSTSGIRMPFCYKAIQCKCRNVDRPKTMCVCQGTNHLEISRYYGPIAVINSASQIKITEPTQLDDLFCNMRTKKATLKFCSIRMKPDVIVTPGYEQPTDLRIEENSTYYRIMAEERLGAQAGKRLYSSLLKKTDMFLGPQTSMEHAKLSHLMEMEIYCHDMALANNHRDILSPDDPRYRAVQAHFPGMVRRYNKAYALFEVQAVIMIRPAKELPYLLVKPTSQGAHWCLNRTSTHYHNTTFSYFVIHLDLQVSPPTAYAVQKCKNTKVDASKRVHGPCNLWAGEQFTFSNELVGRTNTQTDRTSHVTPLVKQMFLKPDEDWDLFRPRPMKRQRALTGSHTKLHRMV